MNKPTILILSDYYLPGFKAGGVLRSVANLVSSLKDDFNFRIITSNHDLTDSEPYENIITNSWNKRKDGYDVFYLSRGLRSLLILIELLRDTHYDLLYINGFFSPKFSIFIIVLSKLGVIKKNSILLAPKGEFSEGALKIKSLKKQLFLIFSRTLGLHSNINWHASTKYEKEDILRTIGKVDISEAVDIVIMNPRDNFEEKDFIKKEGQLKIIFISRISPKKNLHYAIKLLSMIQSEIVFNIYGPIDDENYWKDCMKLFNSLPENIELNYHGSISPNEVYDVMTEHDVFLFPTFGENFGYVIAEALEAGCIPIISDKTPWDDLENLGVGRTIPLANDTQYLKSIEYFASLDSKSFRLISKQAKEYIFSSKRLDESIKNNKKIFDNLLDSNH